MSSIKDDIKHVNEELFNTLTRYLYSRLEVKQCLFISLLQRDIHQALFWGYEYYYSGFEEETFEFLQLIYNDIYAEDNPSLETFILELIEEWTNNDDNRYDCNVGSIIYTLALRPYNLVSFVKTNLNYKITKDDNMDELMPECLIKLLPEHIEKYKTKLVSTENNEKAYEILQNVKLYPVIKEYNNLFDTKITDKFATIYHSPLNTWLFYASKSPIWTLRIEEFNGTIDDAEEQVYFNELDDQEDFGNLWDYDPDELPKNIKEMALGIDTKQLTIRQFCKKFKYTVVSKIVIRKVKKTSK